MAYQANINRTNPGCILILIDQSESMGGQPAETVAHAINKLIERLILRSTREDGVRDYFHVGVLGYGSNVRSLLSPSIDNGIVPISQIANTPLRLEERTAKIYDGRGGVDFRLI